MNGDRSIAAFKARDRLSILIATFYINSFCAIKSLVRSRLSYTKLNAGAALPFYLRR